MSKEKTSPAEKPQEDKASSRERLRRNLRRHLQNKGPLFVRDSDKREDFVYRWVNDVMSRLEDKTEIGYSFVVDDEGKKKSKLVSSRNKEQRAYLMCIPQEIYDEIKAIKAEDIRAIDKAMGRDTELTNEGHVVKKIYN